MSSIDFSVHIDSEYFKVFQCSFATVLIHWSQLCFLDLLSLTRTAALFSLSSHLLRFHSGPVMVLLNMVSAEPPGPVLGDSEGEER